MTKINQANSEGTMQNLKEKDLWNEFGVIQESSPVTLGPYYSYQLHHSPRRLIFMMSYYKFAAKMIGSGKRVLELGCNEGLGTLYLAEFAKEVHGVDFDERAVSWAEKMGVNDTIHFRHDDFLGKTYGAFDAVVSIDVIEHIYPENEDLYLSTVTGNLAHNGIAVIGTPNEAGQKFANPEISGAHVNLYTGDRLVESLSRYFHNVFLFSGNDEMVHTGYSPMAHYFLALCAYKK